MPLNRLHLALRRGASHCEIEDLIAENAAALLEKDEFGRTALFFALENKKEVSLETVQSLASACPKAVTEPDENGDLPIWYALTQRFEEDDSCVAVLVKANPACLRSPDKTGSLPLHRAVAPCMHTPISKHAIVLKMIQAFPDACKKRNRIGLFPIDIACADDSDDHFEVIQALVKSFPQALLMPPTLQGYRYVFHHICSMYFEQMSLEFVLFVRDKVPGVFMLREFVGQNYPLSRALGAATRPLVDHYPSALIAQQQNEQLLCERNDKVNVILSIIDAYPAAAMDGGRFMKSPLEDVVRRRCTRIALALLQAYTCDERRNNHLQCIMFDQEMGTLDRLQFLFEVWPACLELKDQHHGDSVLANAVRFRCPETVDWLLRVKPELAKVKTGSCNSQLPIHLAFEESYYWNFSIVKSLCEAWPEGCASQDKEGRGVLALAADNKQLKEVTYFLDLSPGSIRMRDCIGRLPLYYAIRDRCLDKVRALVNAWPGSLAARDRNGDIPLFQACKLPSVKAEMIELLVAAYPESLKSTNSIGELPIHVLVQSDDCLVSTAKMMVNAWPESLSEKDCLGRLPLHNMLGCVDDRSLVSGKKKDVFKAKCKQAVPLDLIRFMVSKGQDSIDLTDDRGDYALFLACENEKVSLCGIYVLVKASINLFLANHSPSCSAT